MILKYMLWEINAIYKSKLLLKYEKWENKYLKSRPICINKCLPKQVPILKTCLIK
jgi:hypothetical protein